MTTSDASGHLEHRSLAAAIESWFKFNGVPQFAHRYSIEDRLTLLLFLLLSVAAFELGAAPWLDLNAWQLLLALVILMWLTLCAKPALSPILEPDCPWPPKWSIALRALVLVATAVVVWELAPPGESRNRHAWADFPVLFVTAISTAALSSRRSWRRILGRRRRSAVAFTYTLAALAILFAAEGSAFAPWVDILGIADGENPMPQALPGLVVTIGLLGVVFWLVRADRSGGPMPSARALNAQFPAVPLLALALGLEIAVLPHAARGERMEGALPVGLLIAVVVIASAVNRRTPGSGRVQLLPWFAGIFVLAYPAIVGFFFEIDVFGKVVAGLGAFALTAGINALCLGVAFVVVRLGIDRVAGWAVREAQADLMSIVEGLARGLPLLLILTVFLVMQAELWQVAYLTDDAAYLALLGLMIALGLIVTVVTARKTLDGQKPFTTWVEVRKAAIRSGDAHIGRAPTYEFRAELRRLARAGPPLPDAKLNGRPRYNAIAVIAVYQAIVFVPLVLVAAALYWGLARLAVPPEVAGEWIFGDAGGSERGDELLKSSFLDEPWSRVALLLTAFSYLSLCVQIPVNPEQRKDFFAGADRGIRQRLAVRLSYLELVPEQPSTESAERSAST